MSEGVDYKIRVDDSGLESASKKAAGLEQQIAAAEGAQTRAVKEGLNARSQLIRDGLAQQMRQVRENAQAEVLILKEKLKKEEIDQKEYADRFVRIQAAAHNQIAQIKAQKSKLMPVAPEAPSASGVPVGLGFAASAVSVGVLSKELLGLADHAARAKAQVEGLESIVRFKLGQEAVPQAHKALKDITSSGLLSQSDGAAALKNLVSMGYGIDQATKIIQRNTDIAVKNRQAHYSVSEAVRVFTEGVKNGNSVLTDATGITENLEPMLKKYGFTAQDLSDKVNGAAARQALLKEVIKQTEPFVGDADRASKDFTGTMAKLSAQTDETKAALGRVAAEGMAPLAQALTGLLSGFTEWFTGFSDFSQKIIFFGTVAAAVAIPIGIMTTSALAAAGSFGALALAAKAAFVTLLTNPVFLVVAGIAAVVAAIVGIHEATRATPGQALIVEKRQLEDLAKAAELTVEQKKRLSDINRQLEREYGPLLSAMQAEITTYERKLEIIGAIDKAQGKLKKFVELANPTEYANKVREVEGQIKKLSDIQANPTIMDRMLLNSEALRIRLVELNAELSVLQKGAFKEPEQKKTAEAIRVPVTFVRDQTTLEILQDKHWLNDQMLMADQGYYMALSMRRQNDVIDEEMAATKKFFVVRNQKGMELASLEGLELQRQALEAASAKTTDQRKKNELQASLKHNAQLLDGVKRRIEQEKKMKQEQDEWSKKAAGEMFAFGEAMLSAEKGALYKFLADRIRAVTKSFAEEMYAKAAGYAASGQFGMAALYAAGGLAVQTAGEFAARAVEAQAPKTDPQSVVAAAIPEPQQGGPLAAPGTTTITTNNVDARVIVNENGVYMNEAEYIRKRLIPELSKSAAERGRILFK